MKLFSRVLHSGDYKNAIHLGELNFIQFMGKYNDFMQATFSFLLLAKTPIISSERLSPTVVIADTTWAELWHLHIL